MSTNFILKGVTFMVEPLKKVDDADLMPLKKELFKFWERFHNDDFFFIGCIQFICYMVRIIGV